MRHNFYRIFLLFALLQIGFTQTQAQTISFTGTPYTQDFNTLPNTTANFNAMPGFYTTVAGVNSFQLSDAPFSASGLQGWYIGKVTGTNPIQLRVDNGSLSSGATYSYGKALGDADRSLGSIASGNLTPKFGAVFTNNSGNTLSQLVVTFTGMQWRRGGNTGTIPPINTLTCDFGFGASTIDYSGTVVKQIRLNIVSVLTPSLTTSVVDGTLSANQLGYSATLTGLSWANGTDLMIRWSDFNDVGNDDGLAIDNFYLGLPPVNTTPTVLASPLNVYFGNQTVGAANFDYDLTVSGVNLTGATLDVVSNIPGVTLLLNGTGTGVSSLSLPIVSGSVAPTRIVYGLSVSTGSSAGPVSGTVDITTVGVALQTVTLTANIIGAAPYLNASPNVLSFGSVLAGSSSTKGFTVSGLNLTSDLTVSGISGVFEVSADGITGFWPSILVTTAGGTFSGPIYVKFLPTAVNSFSGLVNIISTGATFDVSVSGAGFSASGTGKVTASNPVSLGTVIGTNIPSYNNIWRRGTTNQIIDLNFSIAAGNITKITSQFPPQFSFTTITLLGSAFVNATLSSVGREFTILGVNLTNTTTGIVKLSGVSIPNPPGSNLGKYNPFIYTGDDFGPVLAVQSPTLFVTVPISNIRNASNLNAEGGFVPGVLGDSAAIEGNSQIPTQAYASSNGTFNSLQVYIRDNSAALSIFRNGNAYPGFVTTGTGMIVKGPLTVFNNANQVEAKADRNIILTGNSVSVPPIDVTIENLVLDPEVYEGYLIRILNVSLSTASLAWPATNVRTSLNITDDGNISKTNMLIPYVTSIPNLVFPTTSPTFPADVTGIFTQAYFTPAAYASVPNGYQIIPLKISDIVPVVATANSSNTSGANQLAYPNPMESNELFVYNPEMGGIKVFNGVGAEVSVVVTSTSGTTSKVQFPESSAGIYYVSVQGKNQPTLIKVIK